MLNLINHSQIRMPRQMLLRLDAFLRRELKLKRRDLTLVFLDSAPAQKINLQYRRKNYATDVLSFAGQDANELGELILCPQVLRRQANEHQLSFRQELSYMAIHGVLHLLGYDHELSKREAQKMFELQDRLFERFWRMEIK